MAYSPVQSGRGRALVGKVNGTAPAGLLLACALATVACLMQILHASASISTYHATTLSALLIVILLSCTLLAVLLWRAHRRIEMLERERASNIGKAGIDPLTTLPDRLFFEQKLEAAIGHATTDMPIALVAIDVDRFKDVNDTHGHQAGDRLLLAVVERIRRVVRDGDCLARIGGDEFALLLTRIGGASQCAAAAHRILEAMIAPFDLGFAEIYVTVSLGIAMGPTDGDDLQTLTQASDLALYRAKHEGRNRFAFFDKTMEQKLHLGQTIEDDLRRAIGDDALSIAYQPLVCARALTMHGVEALVRWDHPTLGSIPPEDFIPLAESRGLIVPLGEWVLRRACLDAKRWPNLRIAVNVSPVQFRQRGFVERVEKIIGATGIDPTRLDLELTEGVLIQDAEQAEEVIIKLRALGIRMGLDDFGSGYSSMIYLRRFAFDKVKIDRAFLQTLETSGEGAIILEYIVSLGHALGLSVTAEGVEHVEQIHFLQKLGCDELQGFYFAPALPAHEIDERLSLAAWTTTEPAAPTLLEAPAGRDAA